MANISKVTLPNGTTYDIKDANALQKTENAVGASRLVTKYQISGNAGWYHFLDISPLNYNRSITLLIDQGASHYSGILKIYLGGTSVYFVEWLTTTYPLDQVRWIYSDNKLSLYIYKSTSYNIAFTILSGINRNESTLADSVFQWDNTFISTSTDDLPTGVTAATGKISNQSLTTERLGLQHYIYGAAGWYKFLEIDMEDIATQAGTNATTLNLNLLVQDTYGVVDGILNLCFNINTSHNFVAPIRVKWLSLYQYSSPTISFSPDDVVYTIDNTTHKATVYINKQSTDAQGMIIFYIINQYSRRSTPDISSCWKRESVASIPEDARISTGPTAEYDIEGNKIDTTYLKTTDTTKAPAKAGVYYGVCNSAETDTTKIVTISEIASLYDGLRINVLFANSTIGGSQVSLQLNSFIGASIRISNASGSIIGGYITDGEWRPGEVVQLTYNQASNYWIIRGRANTSYFGVTKLNSSLTSASEGEAATPAAVFNTYLFAASKSKLVRFTAQAVSAASNAEIFRITNSEITTDTEVVSVEFADPSYITAGGSWTSYAGYVAFTGTCTAATTANVILKI